MKSGRDGQGLGKDFRFTRSRDPWALLNFYFQPYKNQRDRSPETSESNIGLICGFIILVARGSGGRRGYVLLNRKWLLTVKPEPETGNCRRPKKLHHDRKAYQRATQMQELGSIFQRSETQITFYLGACLVSCECLVNALSVEAWKISSDGEKLDEVHYL